MRGRNEQADVDAMALLRDSYLGLEFLAQPGTASGSPARTDRPGCILRHGYHRPIRDGRGCRGTARQGRLGEGHPAGRRGSDQRFGHALYAQGLHVSTTGADVGIQRRHDCLYSGAQCRELVPVLLRAGHAHLAEDRNLRRRGSSHLAFRDRIGRTGPSRRRSGHAKRGQRRLGAESWFSRPPTSSADRGTPRASRRPQTRFRRLSGDLSPGGLFFSPSPPILYLK